MTSEELKESFSEEDMQTKYYGTSLIVRDDIIIDKVVTNDKYTNIVLSQNAYVKYLFNLEDELKVLYIVYAQGEGYDVDMEDGVSVLWLHEIEDKYGTCVIMIHTADIDEEKQFDSQEEAEKFLKEPV